MFIGWGDRLSLSAQPRVLGSTHSDAGFERFDNEFQVTRGKWAWSAESKAKAAKSSIQSPESSAPVYAILLLSWDLLSE